MTYAEFKNEVGKKINAVKEKAADAVKFCAENPEVLAAGAVLGGKGLWEIGRACKRHQIEKMEYRKRTTVYDPGIRYNYTLKRPLTNTEAHIYKQRLLNGEDAYEILRSMHVLRR